MPSAQQTADQAAMDQIMAVQLRILEQKMQHAKEAQRRAGTLELQHEAQRRYERAHPTAPPAPPPAPPPPPPKPPSYMHLLEEQQRRYERIDAQHERYRRWLDALPERAKLAVVEVGAGLAVPTVRRIAENATHRFARATLVRVNLDDSEVPRSLGERGVSVGGLGALDALSRIDALMSEEAGHSGS